MIGEILVALGLYYFFKLFEPGDMEQTESGAKHQFWQTMDLTEPWGKM